MKSYGKEFSKSEVSPLEHRELEKDSKKYPTLEDSPLDTKPLAHIAYSSEPKDERVKKQRIAQIPTALTFLLLVFLGIAILSGIYLASILTNAKSNNAAFSHLTPTPPIESKTSTPSKEAVKSQQVSDEEKELIDIWLADNKTTLNIFGDPIDTVYVGATPLFDEKSGRTIERYDYILNHNPKRPWNVVERQSPY